jgi:hypothetical protein
MVQHATSAAAASSPADADYQDSLGACPASRTSAALSCTQSSTSGSSSSTLSLSKLPPSRTGSSSSSSLVTASSTASSSNSLFQWALSAGLSDSSGDGTGSDSTGGVRDAGRPAGCQVSAGSAGDTCTTGNGEDCGSPAMSASKPAATASAGPLKQKAAGRRLAPGSRQARSSVVNVNASSQAHVTVLPAAPAAPLCDTPAPQQAQSSALLRSTRSWLAPLWPRPSAKPSNAPRSARPQQASCTPARPGSKGLAPRAAKLRQAARHLLHEYLYGYLLMEAAFGTLLVLHLLAIALVTGAWHYCKVAGRAVARLATGGRAGEWQPLLGGRCSACCQQQPDAEQLATMWPDAMDCGGSSGDSSHEDSGAGAAADAQVLCFDGCQGSDPEAAACFSAGGTAGKAHPTASMQATQTSSSSSSAAAAQPTPHHQHFIARLTRQQLLPLLQLHGSMTVSWVVAENPEVCHFVVPGLGVMGFATVQRYCREMVVALADPLAAEHHWGNISAAFLQHFKGRRVCFLHISTTYAQLLQRRFGLRVNDCGAETHVLVQQWQADKLDRMLRQQPRSAARAGLQVG